MTTDDNQIKQKLSKKYCCEKCDYVTSRKSNYESHILSTRHTKTTIRQRKTTKFSKY